MLVVPDEAVEKYKAHSIWGQFWIETPTDISLTPKLFPTSEGSWYDLSGHKLDGKPIKPGLYINGGKKVMVK